METYENIFYLRLYQNERPQIIKDYVQGLCSKLHEKNLDFHLDLYLDNMFRDEVYNGGRGPNTTYPYVKFEKTLDDMGSYFSFDVDKIDLDKYIPDIDLQTDILTPEKDASEEILEEDTLEESPEEKHVVSNCSDLLAKIPDDIQNEIVFELKIYTSTSQIYNTGGVMQLEYFLKNM